MKIFVFNPVTGKRGRTIRTAKKAGWFNHSVEFAVSKGLIEPIEFATPNMGRKTETVVHVDGGAEIYNRETGELTDVSYRIANEWVCMCTGQATTGLDAGVWYWHVIPPGNAIRPIGGTEES